MPAIFFALISFFAWGVGDFLVAVTSRSLGAYSSTFWSGIFSLILLSLYIPFALPDLTSLSPPTLFLNLLLGMLLLVGVIAFREAFIRGSSPLVATIATANSPITIILSLILFKEYLSSAQVFWIVVIFIGLFLITCNLQEVKKRKIKINVSILLAFLTMLCWGTYFAFIKIPVREIGWFWPNYFTILVFPLTYIIIKLRRIRLLNPNYNHAFTPLIISVLFARIGELSFNAGVGIGYTSIVAPIAGASPALFVILAFIFLRDPITKQQIVGIITTLIGIVLLSFFSV